MVARTRLSITVIRTLPVWFKLQENYSLVCVCVCVYLHPLALIHVACDIWNVWREKTRIEGLRET